MRPLEGTKSSVSKSFSTGLLCFYFVFLWILHSAAVDDDLIKLSLQWNLASGKYAYLWYSLVCQFKVYPPQRESMSMDRSVVTKQTCLNAGDVFEPGYTADQSLCLNSDNHNTLITINPLWAECASCIKLLYSHCIIINNDNLDEGQDEAKKHILHPLRHTCSLCLTRNLLLSM